MSLVWFLLIGLAAGWAAGRLMRGRGFGLLGNLVVGVVGAVLGGFVFQVVGLSAHGPCGSFIMATIGAVILLALANLLTSRPRPRRRRR